MARALAYMQNQGIVEIARHKLLLVEGVGHSSCFMFQSKVMRHDMWGKEAHSPPAPPPAPPVVPGVIGVFTPTWPLTLPAVLFLLIVLCLFCILCCFAYKGVDFAVDEYV